MPPIIPIVGAIISAVAAPVGTAAAIGTGLEVGGAALGAGEAIDSAVNSGGGGSGGITPQAPPPLNFMNPSDIASALHSIGIELPDLQANTGGSLSPASEGATAGSDTGEAGHMGLIQQAVNSFLGLPSTGSTSPPTAPGSSTTGSPAGTFDISKLMKGINPNQPGFTLRPPF